MSQSEPIDLHIQEPLSMEQQKSNPKTKPRPKKSSISTEFAYNHSDDGTDENLLILLHGDTLLPFAKLARSLKLPQTATLVLQAPSQIPLLDTSAYQWYPSFDPLTGDLVSNPNPTPALELLEKVLDVMTRECFWQPGRINLFGFGQGGSVAVESALRWLKKTADPISSVVSISGPLLSFPSSLTKCPTRVLYFYRLPPSSPLPKDVDYLQRAFQLVKGSRHSPLGGTEAMPGSREEWEGIMRFWSEHLSRRTFGRGESGVYEVLTG